MKQNSNSAHRCFYTVSGFPTLMNINQSQWIKTKIEVKISAPSVILASFEPADSPDSQIWTVNTHTISISIKVQQRVVKKYNGCILNRREENRIERRVELTPETGVCLNETVASKQPGREIQRNYLYTAHFNRLCWSQFSDVIHFCISVISVVKVDTEWLTNPRSTLKLYWANMHLKLCS